MRVCLDTNVFISVSNKERDHSSCEAILNAVTRKQIEGVVPAIVVAEMLVGFYKKKEFSNASTFLKNVQDTFHFPAMTLDVVVTGAEIRASIGTKLPDALIAATSVVTKCDYLISGDITMHEKLPVPVLAPGEFEQVLKSEVG